MKNKLLYILIFAALGFLLLQLPVNNLIGTKARLTFFDMFYPVSGMFLGTVWGILAVVAMQVVNLVFHGFGGISAVSILALLATSRLLPMVAGVLTFSKDDKKVLIIPAVAILAFLANPVGHTVWYFTLFWLIPFAVWRFRGKSLFARAMSATFIAHAVGGAVWIWAFRTTPVYWNLLIPTVILERSIFALGISANYILLNNIFEFIKGKNFIPTGGISIDKKYLLKFSK